MGAGRTMMHVDAAGKMGQEEKQRPRVVAAATAYCDEVALQNLIGALACQTYSLHGIFVVDNSPGPLAVLAGGESGVGGVPLCVEHHPENPGLGGALVRAFEYAQGLGADYLWLFDQDSVPDRDALERSLEVFAEAKVGSGTQLAVVGSLPVHPATGEAAHGLAFRRGRFFRATGASAVEPYECDAVITAGMLIKLNVCQGVAVPGELFLDLVDYEFCLRVRERGLGVVVNPASRIAHRMGEPLRMRVGTRICGVNIGVDVILNNYSATRWYYYFRNLAFIETRRAGGVVRAAMNAGLRIAALRTVLKDAVFCRKPGRFFAAVVGVVHGFWGRLGKRS